MKTYKVIYINMFKNNLIQVSIILVNYNTKQLLRNCLQSVYEKTLDIDFEIYVVDNNSHDSSVEMIKSEFPQVKLIENKENKGFGAANNIAIRDSQAKYVFLLNTDTILLNNAIKIFYDFMEKPENISVACCGGNLYNEEMEKVHSYGIFPNLTELFLNVLCMRNLFRLAFHQYFDNHVNALAIGTNKNDEIREVNFVIGADMFIKKSVLDKLGPFDEDFFMFYEDSELGYRMKKAGYKSVINPDSKIIHLESKSFKDNHIEKLKLFKESEYKYFKKCNGKISAIIAKSLYYLIYLKSALKEFDKFYLKMLVLNYKTSLDTELRI